jgi:hypothetical protein
MQPPPLPDTQKVSYQVPRDVLIRTWWRRMMLRPRRLTFTAFILAFSIVCFFLRQGMEYAGMVFLLFLVFMPIAQYRALAKAVDHDRVWTDPKTLEFGSSQLVVAGPDWKTEMPWTRFRRFSEDATYFYLDLSDSGLGSVIPKSAFSVEQQERFRQYARTQIA